MEEEYSFRARWSESLKKYGHTQISNAFLEKYADLEITSNEAMFIIFIIKYKWSVKKPYPSLGTIAKYMGVKRATVQNYARSLESKGFIKRVYRNNETNQYDINPLIQIIERLMIYKINDRPGIKKIVMPYQKSDTKEYKDKIYNKELVSLKNIIKNH